MHLCLSRLEVVRLPALLDLSYMHRYSPLLGLLIWPDVCNRIIALELQGRPPASRLYTDEARVGKRSLVQSYVTCPLANNHPDPMDSGRKEQPDQILGTCSSLMIELRLSQG